MRPNEIHAIKAAEVSDNGAAQNHKTGGNRGSR